MYDMYDMVMSPIHLFLYDMVIKLLSGPGLGRWAQVGLGMVGVKLVQVPVKRAAQLRVWGLVQG